MKTEIYWFSGTGNSLACARTLASLTGGALISLAQAEQQEDLASAADRMVVVFPCYLQALVGYPLAVERFFSRLGDLGSKEIHALCTCGGHEVVNALPSLRNLERLIRSRGGRLCGGHSVRLPMNNLDYDHIPFPLSRNQEKMHSHAAGKLTRIARRIDQGRRERHRLATSLLYLLVRPLMALMKAPILKTMIPLAGEPGEPGPAGDCQSDRQAWDSRPDGTAGGSNRENGQQGQGSQTPSGDRDLRDILYHTDHSIKVGEHCNSCGTCVRACPAGNIRLTKGRPEFLHHCEMCFACDEWCPQDAIRHWGRTQGVKYRHPAVELKDLLGGK